MEAIAIAALIGVGLKVAFDSQQQKADQLQAQPQPQGEYSRDPGETWSRYMQTARGIPTTDAGLDPRLFLQKREQENISVIAPNTRELNSDDLNDRRSVYKSTLRTNEPAQEKILVGPGVGIGPDVDAADGYHSMYRTPQLLNNHRMTQLAGNMGGPARAEITSRGVMEHGTRDGDRTTEVDHRIPSVAAAQGMSYRSKHTNTELETNRSQTGHTTDIASTGPAGSHLQSINRLDTEYTLEGHQADFTGFKHHMNYGFASGPGGYLQDTSLSRELGDKRSNVTPSVTPGGRMNVALDPINAAGDHTKMRADTTTTDVHIVADASRFQQGRVSILQEDRRLASTESQRNTFDNMNSSVQNLETNPFNIPIFKAY